jgi:hypothetical protein
MLKNTKINGEVYLLNMKTKQTMNRKQLDVICKNDICGKCNSVTNGVLDRYNYKQKSDNKTTKLL